MKTELKRSKLMAKAMKINKKAGIMPDIQNNDGVNVENIQNNEVNTEKINDNEKIRTIEKAGSDKNEIAAEETEQIGSVNRTENINRIQNKDLKENNGDNRKHRDKAPEEVNLDNPVEYIEQNNIISITKERKIE